MIELQRIFDEINSISIYVFLFCVTLSLFRKNISDLFNLYDRPDTIRKLHKNTTSTFNGFLIISLVLAYSLLDFFFFKEFNLNFNITLSIITLSFYLIGLYDDKKNLSPTYKTFLIFLLLLMIMPLNQNFIIKTLDFKNLFNFPIILNQASIFVTIFFIYIFYNLLNFADGKNGVALIVAIAFIVILAVEKNKVTNLDFLILTTLLICLYLNLKNLSFLGNSGSAALSVFISLNYIFEYNSQSTLKCDEIFLIFLIPGMDMTRLVIERTSKGKSISLGDLNHLHHHIGSICSDKYIFIIYGIVTLIPYITSFLIDSYLVLILGNILFYLGVLIFFKKKLFFK